jgi:hypothetical protein
MFVKENAGHKARKCDARSPDPRFWGPGTEDLLLTAGGFLVFSQCMKALRIRYQQTGEFHFK